MNESQISRSELLKIVVTRFSLITLALMVMLFLPAGNLFFWEAWVYLAILIIPMLFVLAYLLKNNPGLLARRMRFREKEASQKRIVTFSFIPFLLAFILPGLDQRFGWSKTPLAVIVLAEIIVLTGYGIIFLVFRENQYASRIIEVEKGQTVIQSGPYAIIRHPMYLGSMLLYVFSPLALGSLWALIPGAMIIPVLVVRILDEEKILTRDLKGYPEYMQKTRYRLIPGIW